MYWFLELGFYIQKTNFIKQIQITNHMKIIDLYILTNINKIDLAIWFLIFLYNIIKIIKIRKSKYNYHDKIVNNLTCMYARQMCLYSLERRTQDLSKKSKIAWIQSLVAE